MPGKAFFCVVFPSGGEGAGGVKPACLVVGHGAGEARPTGEMAPGWGTSSRDKGWSRLPSLKRFPSAPTETSVEDNGGNKGGSPIVSGRGNETRAEGEPEYRQSISKSL